MTTPRSQAISITRRINDAASHEQYPVDITPAREDENKNRIEHYGAIGAILERGVTALFDDEEILNQLHSYSTTSQLRRGYTDALSSVTLRALVESPHIHLALEQSQHTRLELHPRVWSHIENSIDAGAQTAINTIEAVYELLSHLFGRQIAHNPDNSVVVDRLAKLNIDHATLYRDVYLEFSANHSVARQHFILSDDKKSVKWAHGFPCDAPIPVVLSSPRPIISRENLSLDQPCMPLCEIDTTFIETIGCPVTFNPGSIRKLWTLYLECVESFDVAPISKVIARHALDNLTHPDDIAE